METIASYPKTNSTLPALKTIPRFDLTQYSVSVSVDDVPSPDVVSVDGKNFNDGASGNTSDSIVLSEIQDENSSLDDDIVTVVPNSDDQSRPSNALENGCPSPTDNVTGNLTSDEETDKIGSRKIKDLDAMGDVKTTSVPVIAMDPEDSLNSSDEQPLQENDISNAPSETNASQDDPENIPKITNIPILKLTRTNREECKSWSKWLFAEILKIHDKTPDHMALINEIGERKYITYNDLILNTNKAANFLHHHGINKGSHVAICLDNSVEFVYYQIALYLIGAVPVLLNPGHVGSGRFPRFDCAAVLVDTTYYGHILRLFDHFVGAMQIFVLTDDLGSLYIPRFVWIIDGFGFLDFPSETYLCPDENRNDNDVVAFSTSGTTSQKSKIVAHGSASAHRLCTQYLDVLMSHLIDMVALITSNAQFLKSFVKYETEKLYGISSLKVVSYSGSPLPVSIAKKFHDATGASVVQSYSTTEIGPISCGLQNFDNSNALSCGNTFDGISVKITDTDEESEVEPGSWGRILLQSPIKCSRYFGGRISDTFTKNKYIRTGDVGMLDEQNRLYVAGPADGLLTLNEHTIVSPLLENALLGHPSVDDVVVAVMNDELTAGVVVKEEEQPPTLEELNEYIKDLNMGLLTKLVFVDFIPRSETGKLMRSEVLFLLQTEDDGRVVGTCIV
ncbi:hypothetical protein NECAME_00047 [Necator americanus]|uniref:AMP-binding enzyme n=1 Tax=Necator americanus TaxID=51031 RepID=W2TZB0_NECAM|nr:hypothetical protein NECAME_00047 [Necator americanus]ETN87188.1 hypothetical protein NECAME_00047 [Necator americanus]